MNFKNAWIYTEDFRFVHGGFSVVDGFVSCGVQANTEQSITAQSRSAISDLRVVFMVILLYIILKLFHMNPPSTPRT